MLFDQDLVFLNGSGGRWTTLARDVKDFLRVHCSINPDDEDPTGFFLHHARNVGIARFAITCRFDSEALRCYATLMRHSLSTMEYVYSPWIKMYQSRRAINVINKSRPEHMRLSEIPFVNVEIITISPFPVEMGTRLRSEMSALFHGSSPQETEIKTEIKTETNTDHTAPCNKCGMPLSLLGPYGRQDHAKFKHYFMQCVSCTGTKRPRGKGTTIWMPSTFDPDVSRMVSITRTPRTLNKHKRVRK